MAPASAQRNADVLERMLDFCRFAKSNQLNVTQGRVIDCVRALAAIDWANEDDFRLALRTNIASSRAEEQAFDRLFRHYFYGEDNAPIVAPRPLNSEKIRGRQGHAHSDIHDALVTDPQQFSAAASTRDIDLQQRWMHDAASLDKVIQSLARKLATRLSRRLCADRHGETVDLRRTIRRNERHGLDLVDLSYKARQIRKTRLVMLCDVSGSMDSFNPFLLQLMLGVQRALKNSRTFAFSTQVSEITAALRRRSVENTLRELGQAVKHWSGGTKVGAALAVINRAVLREGVARSTVLVIISDGYDNGDVKQIEREMKTAKRRVRKIVWINPMYGASTFQVRAAGMRAAIPYIDHFLPAFDADSLEVLVRELGKV